MPRQQHSCENADGANGDARDLRMRRVNAAGDGSQCYAININMHNSYCCLGEVQDSGWSTATPTMWTGPDSLKQAAGGGGGLAAGG